MFFRRIVGILQILIGIALIYFFLDMTTHKLDWKSVYAYKHLFFKGWLITIALSLASLVLSLSIGLIVGLCSKSEFFLCQTLSRFYVEIIRGTPLLVQILFFYYVVAHAVGIENRYLAGIFILSLFHGAYIAEMIRGGIDTVSATQLESAKRLVYQNGNPMVL